MKKTNRRYGDFVNQVFLLAVHVQVTCGVVSPDMKAEAVADIQDRYRDQKSKWRRFVYITQIFCFSALTIITHRAIKPVKLTSSAPPDDPE